MFPFEAEAGSFDRLIVCVGVFGSLSSRQDFDTGWEYLYDGLVYPQAGARCK